MDSARIGELLRPFLATPAASHRDDPSYRASLGNEGSVALTETQVRQLSTHFDLLQRWNSRVNLTSVREPDAIVTRHFGESLFTAQQLFPARVEQAPETRLRLLDFGSGAGFPGLPIKIWAPQLDLQLIESNQKKATFLREVIRVLGLKSAEVFSGRAEDFHEQAEIVTMRAVEKFEQSLPVAASLVSSGGRLALLIGESQLERAREIEPDFRWQEPRPIPLSSKRVLFIGDKVESS
jgi:16S rRNA (guanine527-N7)-methyltransferase